ncbi:threonylcarbamoyl-AMP synthase [Martelella alba]|uniref:Threonylcarbamoyl-AMP synthase n=1 Tax=Martelella alba TaxID=2590451 RepID=A0A506UGP9_9HYPH|nr:L-threonylcarbamoyladenylate synthase [Martelella alba]TPW32369.1 threonylcarbamoyl-AMP synthase [Martelella alba]
MAQIIDCRQNLDEALAAGVKTLSEGALVAIPTETVYGLAADATNAEAIAKIYAAKGRPAFNPLICHMADLAMAMRYAVFDEIALKLAKAFWPGPLTLILPLKADSGIAAAATAGLPSVGIRVPMGFSNRLIAAFDRPLAAPSANTSGRISPTTAPHVAADLGEKIALVIDNGAADVGVESTILKIADGEITLLRPGGINLDAVETLTGIAITRKESFGAIEAPGMMASHYAPNAPVRLNATSVLPGETLVLFGHPEIADIDNAARIHQLSAAGDLAEAAARLYDIMKQADAEKASRIAFSPIPKTGIGEAINDRLSRAAAPRP